MTSITHVQRVRILYKTILRLHRGLPEEEKFLGNSYVREEFKRHKKCSASEINIFMTEWAKYAILLAEQLGLQGPKSSKKLGENLHKEDLEILRDEQIYQLHELLRAVKGEPENDTKR